MGILNDKLDMLRASNRLPEAMRVAETALDLAQRAFPRRHAATSLSLEKLGQLHDQAGDRAAAKPYLAQGARIPRKSASRPMTARFIAPPAGWLISATISAKPKTAITYYETAIKAGTSWKIMPYSDLGTMLNNVALIYRKIGTAKSGRALLPARARDL